MVLAAAAAADEEEEEEDNDDDVEVVVNEGTADAADLAATALLTMYFWSGVYIVRFIVVTCIV